MMRKIYGYLALAGSLLIWSACSKDHIEERVTTPESGSGFTLQAFIKETPQTRLGHTYNAADTSMKVAWTDGTGDSKKDAFKIYGDSNENDPGAEFIIKTVSSGTFEGEPLSAGNYTALYPSWRCGMKKSELVLDMTNQRQAASGDTKHLTDYNYMTSKVQLAAIPAEAALQFEHEIAIIRFYVKLPADAAGEKVNQFSVETNGVVDENNGFKTTVNFDGTNPVYSPRMTLAVNNASLEDGNTFIAYVAVLPSTINGDLTLTVSTSGGTYRDTIAVNKTYEAGMIYSNTDAVELVFSGDVFDNAISSGLGENFNLGNGSSDDPYLIESAAHLRYLIRQINSNNTPYMSAFYKLTTDIYVTATQWIPIGLNNNKFQGTFDGGNHTISGRLQTTGTKNFGFFSQTSDATIQNLTISASISNTSDECFTGGIAGEITNTTIKNCHSLDSVASFSTEYSAQTGGIVGICFGTSNISNCSNSGVIYSSAEDNTNSGGIAGNSLSDALTISNCSNSGTITSKSNDRSQAKSGGIIGSNEGNISNCNNSGAIYSYASATPWGAEAISGGIAGVGIGTSNISDCNNSGLIFSSALSDYAISYSGGIVGQSQNNNLTGNITINNNISAEAEGTDAEKHVGAFIGNMDPNNLVFDLSGNKIGGSGFSGMKYVGNQATTIP